MIQNLTKAMNFAKKIIIIIKIINIIMIPVKMGSYIEAKYIEALNQKTTVR